ncbi:MAG: bifunctional oligoribonuclease/PAP phosphatase NrnA [Lactobacillus sp.]|jgi:phosphoesterase RecJ-like protein|nr:bifunctional oligoribonuclease/PAP phosphatase NrnA [Lactobacillus sp.]MCH3905971.1 bifunctional oligoribonuclease/PAP phosphatase NrnA [Lactobacillus sp.]MCH3990455.1 bifunctional oligoribonuclease/PAP phosphatase NrnA [Lactobacillus sp.]MCH4068830.1 bifunctional oligoribonuclease/PAP phosphatase NrnA [Lactobacillus sp.]MCI1304455.1 bifunctional oligoribonuclease/PAP phosphatase NrnA [Lactobacillus sp.]
MSSFQEIFEAIKSHQTIIFHRHRHPDPDAIGSQAGFSRSLKLAFPDKQIYCVGQDIGDLDWINTMDEIPDSAYKGAAVITTDCADQPRISDQRYRLGDILIKIDHHPDIDPYADLSYVDPAAPAASEIVYDFLRAENLPITKEVALPLYAGIVGDTGRFMYSETTAHTFAVASHLASLGIDINKIARNISEVTFAQARLQNLVLNYLHLDPSGAAYAVLTTDILTKAKVPVEEASVTVSTPGRIKDIIAWNIFIQQPDGTYRVHYRSKGPAIDKLAQRHHGGGHALASGANAKDQAEIKEIFAEVVAATKEYSEHHVD